MEAGGGDGHVSVVILVFVLSPFIALFTHGLESDLIRVLVEGPQPALERQAKCSHAFTAPLQMYPAGRERSISFAKKLSEQNRILFNHVLS